MSKAGKLIQLALLILLVVAGIRFYLSMRDRRVTLVAPKRAEVALDPDYYVTPKKLHPQDLKDARELTQQPVWVREGYRYSYYPFAGHPATEPSGTLGPIEKLDVTDVVLAPGTQSAERQVMAVFEKDGKRYAMPIGLEERGTYHIYSDDIFFVQDPHQLYKHWPAEVWQSIDKHQVTPGMNELQASFAIGMGAPEGTGASDPRVVDYPNGGHPVKVTYNGGKATQVQPGA